MGNLTESLRQQIQEENVDLEELDSPENEPLSEMLAGNPLFSQIKPENDLAEQQSSVHSYRCTMHFITLMATLLYDYGEQQLIDFEAHINDVEDEYLPEGPPVSPLTPEYFNDWAILDEQVSAEDGSLADIIYSLGSELSLSDEMKLIVNYLRHSRIGLYLQTGYVDQVIHLKELVSNKTYQLVVDGEPPRTVNDIWFARLLPCLSSPDRFVLKEAPYLIRDTTEQQWLDYFARQGITNDGEFVGDQLHMHFKFHSDANYWHDYIVNAFANGTAPEAILLTGIPDVPETLPHHEEASLATQFND